LAKAGRSKPRNGELIYPGTCRKGLQGRMGRAWRLRTDTYASNQPLALVEHAQEATELIANADSLVYWNDRRLGPQQQNVPLEVGDFVLKRADGLWAYQLAVVVDDAAQGITHIVRGEDLADNTARQIVLHCALGLPTPSYLHTPLVRGENGEKLSKQNGAQALDTSTPSTALSALTQAAQVLGLTALTSRDNTGDALAAWIAQWQALYFCDT
jgi:glutamyl-Q tRNA(Asp) synthetase